MAKRRAWKPGDVANGHVLGSDGLWRPVPAPSRWKPGDVANGHLLGADGVWRPLPAPQASVPPMPAAPPAVPAGAPSGARYGYTPPESLSWDANVPRRSKRWFERSGGIAALVVGAVVGFLAVVGAVGAVAGLGDAGSDPAAGGTTESTAVAPSPSQEESQSATTEPMESAGPSGSAVPSKRAGHGARHGNEVRGAASPAAGPKPKPKPAAATFLVTRVVDGDTIELGNGQTVRLVGIDTPERGECGYEQASQHMADLVLGKHVVLRISDEDADRYGRLLRYVDLPAAQTGAGKVIDAGLNQIRSGFAIARYDSRDGYGYHPREPEYIRSDNATKGFSCPKPQPLAQQPAAPSNCMAGYSPCLPIAGDLDCGDIGHSVIVTGSDPYRLDADGDGTGCD